MFPVDAHDGGNPDPEGGNDADECDQGQADTKAAVGVTILTEPVTEEERRLDMDDDGRASAKGRAWYQITPRERQIKQQPGADEEKPNSSAIRTPTAMSRNQSGRPDARGAQGQGGTQQYQPRTAAQVLLAPRNGVMLNARA